MSESYCTKVMNFLKGMRIKSNPNLPGAKQKTPFNINRIFLLLIIIIYTATSACIYFDWTSIRNLLLSVGKYKHLNITEHADITLSPQYKKINNLYPMTLAIHFTTSAFCGFLYDHIGPKFTAIIGQTFNILTWVFLSIDSTQIDTTLIGFVFLGLGADTAFIPILTVSNLFPDISTFILTLIGAAASLSYAVPTTLNYVYNKYPDLPFYYMCYGYIFIILIPCLLVAIFLLPVKPFKGLDYYLESEQESEKAAIEQIGSTGDVEMQPRSIQNGNSYISNDLNKSKSTKNIIEGEDFHKQSIMLFFKVLLSYPSICIIVYFILFNISTVFYAMVTDIYFSYNKSLINMINILMPLSFIPCIIFGRFINKYGAAITIILMNACSALMHLTALIQHQITGVISVFLYMCVASIYTSQIYCFLSNAFPSIVFGKLVGITSLFGGMFSLFCEKLYENISNSSGNKNDPTTISILLAIFFIIMFLPLSILYTRNYEKNIESVSSEKNQIQA
ncbi:novel putative transporter 1, putative [Plasmodium vinckei]|uniref:Novel putative transporter 1, putative n=1 Tax=Plasmodium vinckei TaxID=5860 RepID=A0A6V7SCN0_PLAVN|nr:novel putative transporter 1, putative [Plasmodium vinckei]